jgi:hypothetical protein
MSWVDFKQGNALLFPPSQKLRNVSPGFGRSRPPQRSHPYPILAAVMLLLAEEHLTHAVLSLCSQTCVSLFGKRLASL